MNEKQSSYEENYHIIDKAIKNHRKMWRLQSLGWIDYDDVSQIIRIHIYKKWEKYDQAQPLLPWVNAICRNKIFNIIRDEYRSYSKPCLTCPANLGGDDCRFYGKQGEKCLIYKKWTKSKQNAYFIKLATTLDDPEHPERFGEVKNKNYFEIDYKKETEFIHKEIQKLLTKTQQKAYKLLIIDGKDDEEVADSMGYITSETNRKRGYKQIRHYMNLFRNMWEEIIHEKDICL